MKIKQSKAVFMRKIQMTIKNKNDSINFVTNWLELIYGSSCERLVCVAYYVLYFASLYVCVFVLIDCVLYCVFYFVDYFFEVVVAMFNVSKLFISIFQHTNKQHNHRK